MDNEVYTSPKSDLETPEEWKRSKWLTTWLWFMLVVTGINVPATYFIANMIIATSPKVTMPMIYVLVFMSILFFVFIVLTLENKKTGFYCLLAGATLTFAFNLYAMGVQAALTGIIVLLILSVLLFKGGKDSAWSSFS
ncbi:MAG: hypothetical protein ACI9WC_000252 [Arenicella sp.]